MESRFYKLAVDSMMLVFTTDELNALADFYELGNGTLDHQKDAAIYGRCHAADSGGGREERRLVREAALRVTKKTCPKIVVVLGTQY